MPAWTVISTEVYCHMFITASVTLDLNRSEVTPATGIVLRILYTTMLAAIAERPGVQVWALRATSIVRTNS